MKKIGRLIGRWLLWVVLAGLGLQIVFAGRIVMMAVLDPSSTTFQRSEAWRLLRTDSPSR
jgi:monofunctional biosynthetic peptidoglycan transglycosylase